MKEDELPLLDIARVARAHGLKGDLVVVPITNRAERFGAGAQWTVGDAEYVVDAARPQSDRFVVHLRGVDDRDAAEALRGALVRAPALGTLPEGEMWVHELVGCRCVDMQGNALGVVEAVEDNPAHDILVLDTGPLIPMVFVRAHDAGAHVVTVEPPEGLLELYTGG